ncbi:uncharacterized protein [Euphorbia lathyris]|uniref:uncharacterized protein isoform X1 n=1 Tax=Euphorbia lathyris TaxID=212925 RepID=UPI003313B780
MVYSANGKKEKLPFVPQNIWDEWQKFFTSPEFLLKSKRNSENKKGGKNGAGPSCHTGGSIPHAEHARRIAIELGREPTLHEIFVKTHTLKKDSQTFVDDKARQVNERVVALRQQRLDAQDDNEEELDESQVFIEAAAGKRKDRIYGIGSVACLYSDISGATSVPPPSAEYTAQLEQEVGDLKEKYGSIQEELTQLRQ